MTLSYLQRRRPTGERRLSNLQLVRWIKLLGCLYSYNTTYPCTESNVCGTVSALATDPKAPVPAIAADEVDDTLMPQAGKRKSGAKEGRGRKKSKPSTEDVTKDVIFPDEVPRPGQVNWCPIMHPDMADERMAMVKSTIEITREERDKQLEQYCGKVGWPKQNKKIDVCVGWARRANPDICTRMYSEQRVLDLMKNYARSKVASGRLLLVTDSLRSDMVGHYNQAKVKVRRKEESNPGCIVGTELANMPLWWRERIGVWRHDKNFQAVILQALSEFDEPEPDAPKVPNPDRAPVQLLLLAGNHSTEVLVQKEGPGHVRDYSIVLDIEVRKPHALYQSRVDNETSKEDAEYNGNNAVSRIYIFRGHYFSQGLPPFDYLRTGEGLKSKYSVRRYLTHILSPSMLPSPSIYCILDNPARITYQHSIPCQVYLVYLTIMKVIVHTRISSLPRFTNARYDP